MKSKLQNQFLPIFYTQNDNFSIFWACSLYDVIATSYIIMDGTYFGINGKGTSIAIHW